MVSLNILVIILFILVVSKLVESRALYYYNLKKINYTKPYFEWYVFKKN